MVLVRLNAKDVTGDPKNFCLLMDATHRVRHIEVRLKKSFREIGIPVETLWFYGDVGGGVIDRLRSMARLGDLNPGVITVTKPVKKEKAEEKLKENEPTVLTVNKKEPEKTTRKEEEEEKLKKKMPELSKNTKEDKIMTWCCRCSTMYLYHKAWVCDQCLEADNEN